MRKALKVLAPVLLVAVVLMIAAPRIWVKNKKARLIYKGHTQEDFLLYHGSGGRLLLLTHIPAEAPAMLYDPRRGVASCGENAFFNLKLVRLEARTDTLCTWFRGPKEARLGENSLKFRSPHGAEVEAEWQPPPG